MQTFDATKRCIWDDNEGVVGEVLEGVPKS
jgi:hypothetical protein